MNPDRAEKILQHINRDLASKGVKLDYENYAALLRRGIWPGMPHELIREPYEEYRGMCALFEEPPT